jgi:hypothetical protein
MFLFVYEVYVLFLILGDLMEMVNECCPNGIQWVIDKQID